MMQDNWATHALREMDAFDAGYKKGSKEAAIKVIKWYQSKTVITPQDLKEFAKQFGVEVEVE